MRATRLVTILPVLSMLFSPTFAQDKKAGKAPKESESYDFFQEDALKTMEAELDHYEKSHEDTKAIKGMFIQKDFDDKDKDGVKKKAPPFYKNQLVKKNVKLHLSGGEVVQGETPFNGDKITVLAEKDGVQTTHEIQRNDISTLEFDVWKPFRQGVEPYQGTDFKVKKYYYLPSKAKLLLTNGKKIEGKIDPFEFLTFHIQSETAKSAYGAYFADTMVPTKEITDLLKDKNKNKAELESLEYKWLIANTPDPKYYEKNMPKRTIKKIEFTNITEQTPKNDTPKTTP